MDTVAVLPPEIRCLDHGFVRLVDLMGDDAAIVQAARVSYSAGTKSPSEDAALIDYLMRHDHGSPFEMAVLKFHMKLPIFVARHIVRHRTASINEASARYSVLTDEFYIPETDRIRLQSTVNRQGSGSAADHDLAGETRAEMRIVATEANAGYQWMLRSGIARELARTVLPVSAYTEWYWKIDLRNLLHFLKLRLDEHAQFETRVYADALADYVQTLFPLCWEAFSEHALHAVRFSRSEIAAIRNILFSVVGASVDPSLPEHLARGSRHREFVAKCARIGITIVPEAERTVCTGSANSPPPSAAI